MLACRGTLHRRALLLYWLNETTLLINHGLRLQILPRFTVRDGKIVRFEVNAYTTGSTRCLLNMLSDWGDDGAGTPVKLQSCLICAGRRFNIIATANTHDRGVSRDECA